MNNIEKKFIRNYLTVQKFSSGKVAAWFVLTLCLVLSMFYWDSSSPISSYLSANPQLVFDNKEYWRLLTTTFIHGDIHHLMSNSLMLFILTYFVTAFYGSKVSIMLSYFMGMIINLIVLDQYQQNTTLVGASGIVYYLWGFWMSLYIGISKHLSFIKRLVRVGGIFLILLVPTSYSPNTSYMAHYLGYALGMITGTIYYFINKKDLLKFELWEYRVIEDVDDEADT